MSGTHREGVGRIVGDRYHILRELGRGGMGVVYLGRDVRREMDVAIKLCGKKHAGAMLWLKREFRVVASLRHPNLVELFELVAHDRSVYFTMEYVVGVDPRAWVARERPGVGVEEDETSTLAPLRALEAMRPPAASLDRAGDASLDRPAPRPPDGARRLAAPRAVPDVDFARVRGVLAQLAEALAFLHARGVIHRDVKPSNVLVANGTAKLLDFGLALERRRVDEEVARETRIVGTAAYLAPEYLDRLDVTPAMDVYALGVLAFELVTGAPPFAGAEVVSGDRRLLALPRAGRINAAVPRDLEDVIDDMLAANPARRPSALQIAARIAGGSSRPRPLRRAEHFVGRAGELARLARHLADPTPRARFVVVTGPSGVGKTALVEEALNRARLGGAQLAWRGRCHERELVPYRAFDFAIDDLAAELARDKQLGATLEHAGALGRVFPTLGAVLGAPATPAVEDLRVERERALAAMVQLFDRVIGAQRGVVAIDDLQWADDDSLELLAAIVARATRPLAILATYTSQDHDAAATHSGGQAVPSATPGGARGNASAALVRSGGEARLAELVERLGAAAEVMALAPMDGEELVELIADVAPRAPALHLRAAVAAAAGSPYLAELIARELAETGEVDPRHSEMRRLERLAPAERAVAELAALATSGTTFEQLRSLAELPATQLVSVLRALEDARILKVSPSASGEVLYGVYHQRLREAASAAITPEARRALHLRFAQLGEREAARAPAEQLAHHYERAGERERGAHWAIVAANAARAQLAWGVAADWYERAIALGTPCRQQLAECLFLGGKLAEAARAFEELARIASDPTEPAQPASPDEITGDFPALRTAAAANAADVADDRGRVRDVADAADRWRVRAAEAYLKLGELERGLAILDGVLARRGQPRAGSLLGSAARAARVAARWLVTSRLGTRDQPSGTRTDDVLAATYRVIASFLSTPYPIEAFEYVLREIASAEQAGDRGAQGLGMAMLAVYLGVGSLGRFGDRALASARRLSEASGAPYPRMVAAGAAGILATLRGDWAGMRAAHGEGHRICTRMGLERSWEASFLRSYEAIGEHCAGEPARALAILDELTGASDDLISRALHGNYRARALLLAGDLDGAHRQGEALAGAHAGAHGLAGIYRRLFAGELALAQGAWARAAELGRELERWARAHWLSAMPAVSAMIDALVATGELGTGDRAAAARARTRARALYRRGRVSFYAVTALRLWAQAELRLGRTAAARRILERAHAMSARGGMIDRLAIARFLGAPATGELAFAVHWSTGGMLA
ncbi:MAG: protein kinase [Deltaproteobacteria bacterium]|nr:protein kinase [Deltaproteobacteria bacterium]